MKCNKNSTFNLLECSFYRTCSVLIVLIICFNNVDSIRVYEGTNFPNPPPKLHKSTSLTKKSLLISKRSWNPIDETIKSLKSDRRLNGKWKEINKRTAAAAEDEYFPSLYKINFSEKRYMQYLKYIKDIPRLEEYTFCLWYMPTNLTRDQTLFSYSLSKNERLLKFWINSFDSTIQMSIRENVVYKVPANFQEYKWYHICQSWNGILGEWQIFLDGRRVRSGVLSQYKGTYIPEGGEIILGPDTSKTVKSNNDGLDGEVFGFNLVDESVPKSQALFINSQYKPKVLPSVVPPFKKLPPIKKTYQEIKAYLSHLPSDSLETPKGSETVQYSGKEPNVIKKHTDVYPSVPKRSRGNHRHRYPPVRKVVVYNRDDRQLSDNDGFVEINKTTPVAPTNPKVTSVEPSVNETTTLKSETIKSNEPSDESYSIHSYRLGKNDRKSSNYEIYEVSEDDVIDASEDDKPSAEESSETKTKENFNLLVAREANKMYTLAASVRDFKKPKFHFETKVEEIPEPVKSNRRSFVEEETKLPDTVRSLEETNDKSGRKVSDSIPVYETETTLRRRKRGTENDSYSTADSLSDSNGFRRLPKIPDSFISIFTKNASKTEIEKELSQFFPSSTSTEESNILVKITEKPKIYAEEPEDFKFLSDVMVSAENKEEPTTETVRTTQWVPEDSRPEVAPSYQVPVRSKTSQIKQPFYQTVLTETKPMNFPIVPEKVQELDSGRPYENQSPDWNSKQNPNVMTDRRDFDVSSGTDLVMRSYSLCTIDRGSPIQQKHRLVISWSDTPIRIFGGAQIEPARNECGHF